MKEITNKWIVYAYEYEYVIRCILCAYDSFMVVRTIKYKFKENNFFYEDTDIKELVGINEILGHEIYDSKEEALGKLKKDIANTLEYKRKALERKKKIEEEQEEKRLKNQNHQKWWFNW